jgi:hypothetical protein
MSCCDRRLRPRDTVVHGFRSRTVFGIRLMWSQVKTLKVVRNVVGTAGLVVVGYVFIASLKDLWRYIKISTM